MPLYGIRLGEVFSRYFSVWPLTDCFPQRLAAVDEDGNLHVWELAELKLQFTVTGIIAEWKKRERKGRGRWAVELLMLTWLTVNSCC